MIRLRGIPVGAGIAVGTTVVLAEHGFGAEPPAYMRQELLQRRGGVEPADIVVVANDVADATAFRAPWARVVGIATRAGDAMRSALGVPQVAGIDNLMDTVRADDLVLIDGDLGVVLVDPSGTALAEYQAEREELSPQRRVYVEFEHQPAQTLDGRELRVLARVARQPDASHATDAGADALFLPPNCPALPIGTPDEDQYRHLRQLTDDAPGKPLVVCGDMATISLAALLRASIRADVTFATTAAINHDASAHLAEAVAAARARLVDAQVPFTAFHLAGLLERGAGVDLDSCAEPVHRLLVHNMLDLTDAAACAWLDEIVAHAASFLVPVQAALGKPTGRALRMAVGLGVAGVIVAPGDVRGTKDRIRALDASECREELAREGTA